MAVGVLIGLVAGFYGGKVDQLLMQITDIFLDFPGILLAIAFAAVTGPAVTGLAVGFLLIESHPIGDV